ncbi:hypothetical protein J1605_006375 [Eschrichtius robustus]|uniref:Uncharacterized protein n=1 Tax=Eschrichtius robustus TaxID=9764 RepID=A0AB34GSU1_ESCRO|nr:hypothetical protein J1605_010614 [Eschrichtius robustus]KAJ8786400.1 hypothetical protein J1605_006375 [Eschrichtius robustus]
MSQFGWNLGDAEFDINRLECKLREGSDLLGISQAIMFIKDNVRPILAKTLFTHSAVHTCPIGRTPWKNGSSPVEVWGKQLACCCGNAGCSYCCGCCPKIRQSRSTRFMYALYFILVIVICCIMMSNTVANEMREHVSHPFNSSYS